MERARDAQAARERMLAGLDAQHDVLDVAGLDTSVLEMGTGSPLILLHGAIECGGAIWARVLPRLAETYRVVVPDVPGLGESAPARKLDADTFTRWFSSLLDTAQLHRPMLVAHSLVGSLACRLAVRRSRLLSKLVVYATPAVGAYRAPIKLRYVATRFAVRPTPANAERFDRFVLYDYDATYRQDPDWYRAFSAYSTAQAAVPHVKRTMSTLIRTQTKPIPDPELDRITTPAVLLWGRHDRMMPLALATRAASRHRWPLHIVENAGHAPHIERPDDFVAALLAVEAQAQP